MEYSQFAEQEPYALSHEKKQQLMLQRQKYLLHWHGERCPKYRNFLQLFQIDTDQIASCEQLPFLPVQIFKEMELKSIEEQDVFKVMTSSGTTGQAVSKIFLDRETAANQQKTLAKIVNGYLGARRLPMLILDCPSVIKDRRNFSARGAGILGFQIFASKKQYAFTDDMELDMEGILRFLNENQGKRIFMFGFTYMIWQFFYKKLLALGQKLELKDAILIHGGGWKKLQDEAVSSADFHKAIQSVCGVSRIYDYYGMVEQTGCIYMECEYGHLHASIFSDVIMRNSADFSVCRPGEQGLIQVLSAIPQSYPGQSVLTEDTGILLGEDDCPCGRLGKYFKVTGRIRQAEVRGCSDTYEKK